jgi:hypothetical protein
MVFILFFPVPIRIAAVILIIMYIINVIGNGANAGGDAAHLGGMATGAIYVFAQPLMERLRLRRKSSLWERRMSKYRDIQAEVDRILEKVHAHGIQSLTRSEKKTLELATRQEQMRNKMQISCSWIRPDHLLPIKGFVLVQQFVYPFCDFLVLFGLVLL